MIKISDLRVPEGADPGHIKHKAARILRVSEEELLDIKVLKRSRDARRRNNIVDVYTIAVEAQDEEGIVSRTNLRNVSICREEAYSFPKRGKKGSGSRPVVTGFGPAGIFASLILAHEGYRPVVYERGKRASERAEDVERFFETGVLDTESNVQFGEGGAGTFSDGKLNSGVKDREGRKRFILETFVRHGADEAILTDQHPHIGTDRLRVI
ncbi:MAG: FAD-dependent oxidoreductase, partial [Lachnospiraceae bacterium]|nr:FAD-dependent oxidoreductase [Lachnospiraceae bacterium]